MHLAPGGRPQHEAEEAVGARVVAPEQGEIGRVLQRRVEHLGHLRPALQPARDVEPARRVRLEPHLQGAKAAQHQVGVVRRHRPAHVVQEVVQRARQHGVAHGHRAHEGVGVAAHVLGQRLDREVHARVERLEQEPRAPGAVDGGEHAARPAGLGDGADVLQLEGERGGALHHHQPRGRSGERQHLLGRGARGEVAGADAVARQQSVAEPARGAVHAVGAQHLVARLEHRHQRRGDGRRAGGEQHHVLRPLQRAHRLDQGLLRQEALAAVGDRRGVERGGVRQDHGGAALHRRVDGGRVRLRRRLRAAGGADQAGGLAPGRVGRAAAHGAQAAPVATAAPGAAPHSAQEPS